MINQGHFQQIAIKDRLDELHRLWDLLLTKLSEKGLRLQEALILVQFQRQCDEVLFWIKDKVIFFFFSISRNNLLIHLSYFFEIF